MKLVLVKWIDAAGVWEDWEDLDESTKGKNRPAWVDSVGLLFEDTPEYVVIVPHVAELKGQTRPLQGTGAMAIPRRCIISMRELVEGES